jgi:hypothetical protein
MEQRPLFRALAVLVGALVSPLGGFAAAAPATAPVVTEASPYAGRVGMNSHMLWYDPGTSEEVFRQQVEGGVTHTREDFVWSVLEPQRGQHDWWRADNLMTGAARAGMQVHGIIDYSAPWASSQGTNTQALPAGNDDYARFAAAVAERYGTGGSFWASHPELTPVPVRSLEIWNEAAGFWNSAPNPDPARYASLAVAAAQAINTADPQMQVLIDGSLHQSRTDGQQRDWISAVLAAQPFLASLVDAYSVHPYPQPPGTGPWAGGDRRWSYAQVLDVRERTAAAGAAKPIWITEVGWSTATGAEGAVSEATQASYLSNAITRAFDEWGHIVERVYLYSFDRDGTDPADREAFFGVRRHDGSFKPAWSAITGLLADRAATSFSDVPADHPFFAEVEWMAAQGVSTGYPDGTFRPGEVVRRAAMSAFLQRLADAGGSGPPSAPSFSDVPVGHPFFTEVGWMAAEGISTGYPDGTFRPGEVVSRAAMSAFLHRFAGGAGAGPPASPSFSDVPADHPFFAEVEWMAAEGIATGYADGSFRPTLPVRRAAVAAFLQRVAA